LGLNDFLKGVIVAVLSAIVVAIGAVVLSGNFDAFTTDWLTVGQNAANAGIVALVGYLLKNLFTTNDGKILGANLG
jgi:hypothetical protein